MGEAGQVPGIGWQSLALSFVSLGAVCVVAWLALRLLAGRGIGKATGAIRVVARCPLEPRRSVYIIEAGGRCFLVGVGEGAMAMLGELDGATLPAEGVGRALRFADVLAQVLGRQRPPVTSPSSPSGDPPGGMAEALKLPGGVVEPFKPPGGVAQPFKPPGGVAEGSTP